MRTFINMAYGAGLAVALLCTTLPILEVLHRLDYNQLNQLNVSTKGEMQSDIEGIIEGRRVVHQRNNAKVLLGGVLMGIMLFGFLERKDIETECNGK